jgi:hypothetical protein
MSDEPRTISDDALPECCVRIDVGGSHAGSGFFVAPGVVVTCHHVLKLGDLSSDEAGPNISVVSPFSGRYDVLDARESSPTQEDDLAILRVEPADGHPFVLLDTGLRARDELHTFGFPEDYPDGAPTGLVADGWMQRDRWLKVAHGQVRRGMSGSPVVNRRTGAVCGILKRTSDPGQALGGYAVSVRRLFLLSPMLTSANFRHHTTHRRQWFDLLPAKEQQLLLRQRTSAPAALPDCVFVISVDQTGEEWQVSATVHRRVGDGDEWDREPPLGPISVDLNSVRALVARVFRDWASREAAVRGRVEPGEQIRLLGAILSHAVLTAEIGEKFDELVARPGHGWLEVALHFAEVDDPDFNEFVQLPWEHLYLQQRHSRGDVYFAREPKLAFVRTLYGNPETPKRSVGKLSLLVVAVKPDYQGLSDKDARIQSDVNLILVGLRRLATELGDCLEVKVIDSPGLMGLDEEMAGGTYDAIHYIGFGRFDQGTDRIALAITPSGRGGYVDAPNLAACLHSDRGMPRLVVLQVLRGSEPAPADLAAFGPSLLTSGTEAVIAHQYPVTGELTERFNAALYGALTDGTPLEMAAQVARKKVWSSDSEGRAFLSPAVFVRHPGGLRLTPESRETGLRSRVGALPGHA